MKKQKRFIKRSIAIFLAAMLIMSTFIGLLSIKGFATSVTEDNSLSTEETTETIEFMEPITDNLSSVIPEETLPENNTEPSTNTQTSVPTKDKYKITFSLYEAKKSKEITIVLLAADNKTEHEIVLTKKDEYFKTVELPLGTYSVKEVKSNDKFVKITLDINSFNVEANDLQNYSITVVEKEVNFFLKFLARNWVYLILLGILMFVYMRIKKKKNF